MDEDEQGGVAAAPRGDDSGDAKASDPAAATSAGASVYTSAGASVYTSTAVSVSAYQCPWEEDVRYAEAVCKQLRTSTNRRASRHRSSTITSSISSTGGNASRGLDGSGDCVPLHILPAQRTYFDKVHNRRCCICSIIPLTTIDY
jgi:hypothetical protein